MHPLATSSIVLLPALPVHADEPTGEVTTDAPTGQDDPVLHRVTPAIPEGVENFEHTRQARCEVDFEIARDGTPRQIEVSGCVACYESATKQAAHQWRFEPGTKTYQASFDFRVDVTDPEPSAPVMRERDTPNELSVQVSIPVLSLVMSLDTQPGDGWPGPHPETPKVRRSSPPAVDRVASTTLRHLQEWYGLTESRCEIEIWVDERGRAKTWRPIDCSHHFHPGMDTMLKKWRWEPLEVGGEPQPFSTWLMVSLVFAPNHPRDLRP